MLKLNQLACCVLPLIVASSMGYARIDNSLKKLEHPGIELLKNAEYMGAMNPHVELHFNVWLNLRNQEQLQDVINTIYDPTSPNYQQFLTDEQFASDYAPSDQAIKTVEAYFNNLGMSTKQEGDIIEVTGTVKQIEAALQVNMSNYRYKNKLYYSNKSAPVLSQEIAPLVSGITGLTNLQRFRPTYVLAPEQPIKNQSPVNLSMLSDTFKPGAVPTTTSFAGFNAQQLRTAYNVAAIPPIKSTPIDGTGQTIVILDVCGSNSPEVMVNDANAFGAAANLPPLVLGTNFKVLNPNGTNFNPASCAVSPEDQEGWAGEIALDIEAAHAIAPGANIALVYSKNGNIDAALATLINTLTTKNYTIGGFKNAYVISNSWGGYDIGTAKDPLENSLKTAASRGLSINFSSGDCGDEKTCVGEKTTDYPTSSIYVGSIGGTTLLVDKNWKYSFESGWGTNFDGQFYGGSGGGISTQHGFKDDSSNWQSTIRGFSAGGYGLIDGTYCNRYQCRAVPDISMVADSTTGLNVYLTEKGKQTVQQIGGTSLSCPLFTATLALANQYRQLSHASALKPLGLISPYLYRNQAKLMQSNALNFVSPPHVVISGGVVQPNPVGAPDSAFTLNVEGEVITFNWDSSLTVVENQFWNDVTGLGTPNVPKFVIQVASF